MFIVTKLIVIDNKIDIVKVVDDDLDFDRLVAYDSMIKNALEAGENCSVKNVSDSRIEIYIKGVFGSYLGYVYTLHEIEDDDDEEVKQMDEVN